MSIMQFFKNHSKMVLVSTILISLYAIFLMSYFYGGVANSNSDAEAVGGVLATALVTPHMILIVLGAVFSIVALFANKKWAAITSCVLVFVSTLLMPIYFMFTIPLGIIGIIAIVCLQKLNEKADMNKAIQN